MHVTVFGANGQTGSQVVTRALAAGHTVTAFVRDPAKAPKALPSAADRLHIAVGDARDPQAVAAAIQQADVIVSAIGNNSMKAATLITDCMTTIVAAASQRPEVSIFAVSTVGAGDSASQLRQPIKAVVMLALRNPIKDHNGAEAALAGAANSSLVVRCVGLTNGDPTGKVTASAVEPVSGSRISRADVADYIVTHLDSPDVLGSKLLPGSKVAHVVSLW